MRQTRRSIAPLTLILLLIVGLPLLLVACSGGSDDGGAVVVIPPAELGAITDLAVTAGDAGTVTLSWTSPAVLDKADLEITYDLRYATLADAETEWATWTIATPPDADSASGVARTYTVTGLAADATYVFEMRTTGGGDWSASSNMVVGTAAVIHDNTSPEPITDLRQWAGTSTSLTFAWTAAHDDGHYGALASHELRYATTPITAENWAQASMATGTPSAGEYEGSLQLTVSELTGETTYYCAVIATDDEGLSSGLSNVPSATTGDLNVIRVYVDGTGDYPTIERAIGAAEVGDLILVGPGRYTWTNQGTGDPLHGMINVPRDWQDFEVRSMAGAELTILDAEGNGAVMSVTGGSTQMPDGSLDYAGIIIDGFTFTGGAPKGTEPNQTDGWAGGGINVHLSDTVIRNCIFRGNEAHDGGGVWIGGQGDAVLEDCLIEDNSAYFGGGVMLINSEPRINIRRCTIRNNQAQSRGGGMFNYHCTVSITDCEISGNTTLGSGGGISSWSMNPGGEIVGCTIVGNDAHNVGAGVFLTDDTTMLVERSIVAFNLRKAGLTCTVNSVLEIGCSLVHGNEGGDDFPYGTVDLGNNLSDDPLLCDLTTLSPSAGSPCLPGNRDGDECGVIGAQDQGCQVP